MSQAGKSPQISPKPIIEIAFAFAQTYLLASAIELDLFTNIDNGHDTVISLAGATGGSQRGLRAMLNALSAMGLLEKHQDRFALTPTAKTFLSRNGAADFGAWVRHMLQIQPKWAHLTETVRAGKPAVDVHGEKDQGEFFSQFVEGLFAMNQMPAKVAAEAIRAQLPEGREIQVLDIGAGSGVWGFTLAKLEPRVRVTDMDWPKVLDTVTRRIAKREGLEGRVDYLPGNLHEVDFGADKYDVAILGHICHGEGAAGTRKLFAKVRRALRPDGHLIIADFLPDEERATAEFPLIFAVNMLVATDEGDVFTFGEYGDWLREAGFDDVRRIEFPGDVALIGARREAAAKKVA